MFGGIYLLFHVFQSQSERRNFGGSDFIEIQYCKLPQGSTLEKIVAVDSLEHWKNDSLYVFGDDMEVFYQNYGSIITGGVYNNQKSGPMDLCGINFYSYKQAAAIMECLQTETPPEYQTLQKWLQAGEQYIGFYVLDL